jgi:hypothetical protein
MLISESSLPRHRESLANAECGMWDAEYEISIPHSALRIPNLRDSLDSQDLLGENQFGG